jgi:hypothetical protein
MDSFIYTHSHGRKNNLARPISKMNSVSSRRKSAKESNFSAWLRALGAGGKGGGEKFVTADVTRNSRTKVSGTAFKVNPGTLDRHTSTKLGLKVLMCVPCIVRLSITDQHYALIIIPLFVTKAPTCFGIHVPSSASFLYPYELLERQKWLCCSHVR